MENAADALQMAAAVLIFVLALTIAINSFGQVRQISQLIIGYNDREYDYTYVEDNGTTERIVGLESIIPSIYKAYRENYKIVFDKTTPSRDSKETLSIFFSFFKVLYHIYLAIWQSHVDILDSPLNLSIFFIATSKVSWTISSDTSLFPAQAEYIFIYSFCIFLVNLFYILHNISPF